MSDNVTIQKIYSLTPMQQGMLYHSLLDKHSNAYFQQMSFTIHGDLSRELFEQSLNRLIARHDVFRTIFKYSKVEEPIQIVLRERLATVGFQDLSELSELKQASVVEEYSRQDRERGFDLTKDLPIRASMLRLTKASHRVIWSFHHIIMDGWCMGIIIKEFFEIYQSLKTGQPLQLEPVFPYSEYIDWLQRQSKKEASDYWQKQMEDYEQPATLPHYQTPAVSRLYQKAELIFTIEAGLTKSLEEMARENQVTLYILFQTIWGILLQRYNQTEDVVFGSVVSGRPAGLPGVEKMVGLFINTIPVRVRNGNHRSFLQLAQNVQETALVSQRYEYYPLAEIQSNTQLKQALFDHLTAFENYPVETAINRLHQDLALTMDQLQFYDQTNYDFNVIVGPGSELSIRFNYNQQIFHPAMVHQIAAHLQEIIKQVAEHPDIALREIDPLTPEEKASLLCDFNPAPAQYPEGKTILELFEEQAARSPEKTALEYEGRSLTYRELNAKANQVGAILRNEGIQRNSIVGLMLERSLEMVIGILGILKAGGTYLPMEIGYPRERIDFMVADSGARVILTGTETVVGRLGPAIRSIPVSCDNLTGEVANLAPVNQPRDPAYIIYTSGTTGKPKGVIIEHWNVVRLLFNDQFQFDFHAADVWTMFHSYCFDFSVWEMYGALLYGGKLIIVPRQVAQDPGEYLKLLAGGGVTVLNQTPTAFYNLAHQALRPGAPALKLRYVIFGGEALQPVMLKDWRRQYPEVKLINMYGITETTVHVTYKEITEQELDQNLSNIGKPIPTLTVYSLDPDLRMVPVGVAGEICVGGAGVSRGYLNRPELTAEKFVLWDGSPRGGPQRGPRRIYRSGDLARWLPEGDLEYLGRIDHQVKIRGHRIELGEIEVILLKQKSISEAVVIARPDSAGNQELCAYLVADEAIPIAELRETLSRQLPEYMIPAYFIRLEKLPLTANGKLDRKALPAPEGVIETGAEYEAPRTPLEAQLVKVWQDVLGVERVGMNDSFFDLGGDSIKAIRLAGAIKAAFETEMEIKSLYQFPIIREFGEYLAGKGKETQEPELIRAQAELEQLKQRILADPEQVAKLPPGLDDFYPMSDIELGMVYHNLKSPETALYHDQMLYLLTDREFDYQALEKSVGWMMLKHPILRTSFNLEDFSLPIQFVHSTATPDLELIDIKGQGSQEQATYIRQYLADDRKHPFDIHQILWRIRVFAVNDCDYHLALICHHAILDGWSVASFTTELANLYFQFKTGEVETGKLTHSYRDFIIEQEMIRKQSDISDYWISELSQYQRPRLGVGGLKAGRGRENQVVNRELPAELTEQLREIARQYQTDVRTLYFIAYGIMIMMMAYEHDIVIGLVEHNRPNCAEGDQILGCFLNTVPVRFVIQKGINWDRLIQAVSRKLAGLKRYGRLPLVEIIKRTGVGASDENPLFETLFNYIDFHIFNQIDARANTNSRTKPEVTGYQRNNTLFNITVVNNPGKLLLSLDYPGEFFGETEGETLADYYENALHALVYEREREIKKEDLMPSVLKQRIINSFNSTWADYPKDKTIMELFEEQVERTPGHPAVVFGQDQLTYRELNQKANQLGRLLREKGIGPEQSVGLMVERSLEMVIGIFGILKAGAAYLPIDYKYPEARIDYIFEDSGIRVLLTQQRLEKNLKFEGEILTLDVLNPKWRLYSDSNIPITNQPGDLAYVIYTSGSTGNPKGVMIEHHSVVNTLVQLQHAYPLEVGDAYLLKTPFVFDVSVTELLGWFFSGGRLVILEPEAEKDPAAIVAAIRQYQVTHVNFVPSMLSAFLEVITPSDQKVLEQLKYVFLAGEALPPHLVNQFFHLITKVRLENLYGPTESTIYASWYKIKNRTDHTRIPIGLPFANLNLYVVSSCDNLQPIGVDGELWISGVGLARGYLNNPDLTAAKFSPNPFDPSQRIYRTGDLTRWLPDGNIEFLGRIDHQVKIRGYRIELGEIETRLLQHEDMKEAVVIAREDHHRNQYLSAYFVSGKELTVSELREYIGQTLPEYMIPAYFIRLEKLPLTHNGKVDRKTLASGQGSAPEGRIETKAEYLAPRNAIEMRLADLWQGILGIERVGIQDNFFELGGDSLKATILVGRIHRKLNLEIPLREIFNKPTIRELADHCSDKTKNYYETIHPAPPQSHYPLSSAQKRLFILNQMEGAQISYNIPGMVLLEGGLDRKRLENSFKALIQRHESLRTSFEVVDGEPVQRIWPVEDSRLNSFRLEYWDVSDPVEGVDFACLDSERADSNWLQEPRLQSIIHDFIRPFDLSQAPLLRTGLIGLGADKYLLLFDLHHIITDAVSMGILEHELLELYDGKQLPALRIQYKDYSIWQNRLFQSEAFQEQTGYWREQFTGEIPILNFPTDHPRPKIQSFTGDHYQTRISPELTAQFNRLAVETGSTLFMVLMAAFNLLLSKYTGQEDIIVGSPIAGRPHPDLERIIGMFVNTLALRNYPAGRKTFREFLDEVKETALKAYEYQDYQFEELVECLNLRRDLSRNPLFDVMFVLQNTGTDGFVSTNLKISPYGFQKKIAIFDLTVTAVQSNQGIDLNFEYATALFTAETISRLAEHFLNLLTVISRTPDLRINQMEMLSEAEKQQLLIDFNNTPTGERGALALEKTIQRLFEEQVARTPEAVAVDYEGQQLNYRELNTKANQLARNLRAGGVKTDEIVGLMVDRTPAMIIGILGILKAGGAYLPIDPSYPQARIAYLLQDSQARVAVSQNHLAAAIPGGIPIITLEALDGGRDDGANLEPVNQAGDLAYVIYTSGSTGNPKGVMIQHENVIHLLSGLSQAIYSRYKGPLKVALIASYVFDASVQQIFAALCLGHSLFIVPESVRSDGEKLIRYYQRNAIDISDGTPTHLQLINSSPAQYPETIPVKHFIIGGEALSYPVIRKFNERFQTDRPLVTNVYGPTECCVDATSYLIEPERLDALTTIPIGKPLADVKIYILDRNMGLIPPGVPGELYISGAGVGRGYMNRSELTADKFIRAMYNVECIMHNEKHQRAMHNEEHQVEMPSGRRETGGFNCELCIMNYELMYRTGDLARWLPDGNIEFIERLDHQVKIRGFRIELGEIEARLLELPSVKEAVAVVKEDENADKLLCAYYIANAELTVHEFRTYLAQTLPEYMIPSYFIPLERLPLTLSGKIDRKALASGKYDESGKGPAPEQISWGEAESSAPLTKTEQALTRIWQKLLGCEQIAATDDFFELGGHSLKASRMVALIHQELNVELPLGEIFKTPTISDLAKYIDQADQILHTSIQPAPEREYYPVSAAQKRLYLLMQFEGAEISYNMPGALQIEGRLDRTRLENVIRILINRHEALRTSFDLIQGEPVQIIHPSVEFQIHYLKSEPAALPKQITGLIRAFDLKTPPLIRVFLIEIGADKYILLFDLHHIIADGVSTQNLIGEFTDLYQGQELPPLRIQYKDFALWQNELIQSGKIQQQEAYWVGQFRGQIPVLNLPTDFPRPLTQSFDGDLVAAEVNAALTQKLKQLSADTGLTLYMALLAGYTLWLAKCAGQEEIIVGSAAAGRSHADLEPVIGMFVNTLALRNFPTGRKTLNAFLAELKENTLNAFENQDFQFEELITRLALRKDLSRNPLFDVVFSLQNQGGGVQEISGLTFTPYEFEHRVAKFDLLLTAVEVYPVIKLSFEYSTKLFKKETITRWMGHFLNVLEQITGNPNRTLDEIELLTPAEKQQILSDFNRTQVDYPSDQTIRQLFESQATRTPDEIALVAEGKNLSYRELNRRANQLAGLLCSKGAKPGELVGIMIERSLEMIIGILGIIKAGAAYLPIDPHYPSTRIEYLLQDSQAMILLMGEGLEPNFRFDGERIMIKEETLDRLDDSTPPQRNRADDPVYAMFTSGSTGKPKGVLVTHRNVLRLVIHPNYITFGQGDRILLTGAPVFDATTFEIWGALLNGLRLYLVPETLILDAEKLGAILARERITTMWLTAPLFNQLSQRDPGMFSGLTYLLVGGDALTPKHINRVRRACPKLKIINGYGPTENTTFTACFFIDAEYSDNIPIGTPISNSTIYIVNRNQQLQPVGIPGELYTGGDGVALGYLNHPELTHEKFVEQLQVQSCMLQVENQKEQMQVESCMLQVENQEQLQVQSCELNNALQQPSTFNLQPSTRFYPSTFNLQPSTRLYRTGDLARWLPNGVVEFLGRIDHQVKIRGYRIEVSEIEIQLLKYELITEAMVIVKETSAGDKYLLAYFVAKQKLEVAAIRDFLAQQLPDYMIPAYFIQLDQFPLNTNGKIDSMMLPAPGDLAVCETECLPPRTELEAKLVAVWQEVLGTKPIGINHNFFDLGGDSIKAIQLATRLHQQGLRLEIKDLFQRPRIAELSNYVKAVGIEISQEPVVGNVALTPIQRWFFEQQMPESHHFNQSLMLYHRNGFDENILSAVFRKIIEHHDALRMVFQREGSEIIQYNRGTEGQLFSIQVFDFRTQAPSPERIPMEADRLQRSIDLANGPLVKLGLFKTTSGDHLLIVIHHLVVDGVSWRIILGDLAAAYQQLAQGKAVELPGKTNSYQEWADQLRQYATSKELLGECDYWAKIANLELQPLPKDHPGVENRYKDSHTLGIDLTLADTELLLKQVNRAYNTEINDILLTALGLAIQEWTGIGRVLINLEGHGREELFQNINITRTVGWFTTIYPALLEMIAFSDYGSETEALSYQIRSIKEGLRSVPNRGIGYGVLKYLTGEASSTSMEFKIKPEICFNYLGQFDFQNYGEAFAPSSISPGTDVSPEMARPYVLDISGVITGAQLHLNITYNRTEYEEATIQKLLETYRLMIVKLIGHCTTRTVTEVTPSDLVYNKLSLTKLQKLNEKLSTRMKSKE